MEHGRRVGQHEVFAQYHASLSVKKQKKNIKYQYRRNACLQLGSGKQPNQSSLVQPAVTPAAHYTIFGGGLTSPVCDVTTYCCTHTSHNLYGTATEKPSHDTVHQFTVYSRHGKYARGGGRRGTQQEKTSGLKGSLILDKILILNYRDFKRHCFGFCGDNLFFTHGANNVCLVCQ